MRIFLTFFTLFFSVFLFANSDKKQNISVFDIEIDADLL